MPKRLGLREPEEVRDEGVYEAPTPQPAAHTNTQKGHVVYQRGKDTGRERQQESSRADLQGAELT